MFLRAGRFFKFYYNFNPVQRSWPILRAAGDAFTNGCHVVRQIWIDLDASKPCWGLWSPAPCLPCGLGASLVAEPLRVKNQRNGADGTALLGRPRLNAPIHRVRDV